MNILMFNYEYPPLGGGGGVVHALLAAELARTHRVCVVTSAFEGLPRHEVREGVEIFRIPVLRRTQLSTASLLSLLSYPPSVWARTGGLLRGKRFDLVNAHFAVPTGPGSLFLARRKRIPHVLTVHGGDIYDPSKRLSPHRIPPIRAVVSAVLRRSAVVVANSVNTRAHVQGYYGFSGPIEVIPWGIRQHAVPALSRRSLGLPENVFLGVTVGRLIPRKALDVLLRALARPENAPVHLVVIGTGPERDSLLALAARLGIERRVIFSGQVEETRKWQILAASDAYLSSTMHEGFGLVYLEGMASGLPIVTPDFGGQSDFLKDGETGYLVPAGDEPALAAAIACLHRHRDSSARMGRRNLELAPKYGIERCATAYESLFERTIAQQETKTPADLGRDANENTGVSVPSSDGIAKR
jgi:glycosyltransferase involved in cell wall biosynthesis